MLIHELLYPLRSNSLAESRGHIDHPEDLVFIGGKHGAAKAIVAISAAVKNPALVTIKFDGYPALIFGKGADKKFTIVDKHMFNKKDGSGRRIFNAQEFAQYDELRGVNRSDLIAIIGRIWKDLRQTYKGVDGYYWGDLLFSQPLVAQNGVYKFRANPNGLTYTVVANSELGKLIGGKIVGIAVHQFIPATATSTDDAMSLNGTVGNLQSTSKIAIVPSKMPITPKLKVDAALKSKATQELAINGASLQQLLDLVPVSKNTFAQLFTVYINTKIVSGNLDNLVADFYAFIAARKMTDSAKAKITEYLIANKNSVQAAFNIWSAIYNFKMSVVLQLNAAAVQSPIQGYLQDGTQSQEGFVVNNIKLVNRMGFSRQNLAGRIR